MALPRRGGGEGARQDWRRRRRGSKARRSSLRGGPTASLQQRRCRARLQRDGRGAAFVMGAERGGVPIDLFRRPLDPLQARGHFFYVSEDGEAPWSIGFEPARRAGEYRIEETGLQPPAIVNALNGIEARMEVAPDPEGAVLSWRIRLENKSGRPRRLRLTSFCEIAGHETGAYANDLDFAGMHVETFFVRRSTPFSRATGFSLARAPAAAKRRSSRSSRARGGLVGYEDSRIRFIGEGSLQADRLRALALAQARRRRQALDLRSGRELHARGDARARRDGRGRIHRRPRRQRGLGAEPIASARPSGSAGARVASASRNPRRRAVAALPSRWPFASRPTARCCASPIARPARGRM